ncbi:hypothetical protein FT663_00602 [Candidozyma haemuli var. vulneris]|uniref:Biogenesis of lysosome-related organelles complex 1 subunit 2 n=1 Tax=Candidozyma haemuli TaxID=45357 RepID=A0A2V1ANU4_9ASCO|nr:hypothetical protein CXQ85_003385 [[Candida] haemuloni]KAF3989020.1 hypothetical protein FT662_03081 [[Candida] haemuloni var. vulneris]KAF3995224.1 hypothetical protein FT663_00602 [[Candida] haemuloni var. vulneris]PVH19539.1 hypothetical protein CXQ85_003385 [[Candida] haemuloni]
MSKDTSKLVSHALNQALQLNESDTQVSTIDLNLLVNLNTNQSLNYIKLEQDLNELEVGAKKSEALQEEFKSLQQDLAQIEKQVDVVTELVNELDGWTKELEEEKRK